MPLLDYVAFAGLRFLDVLQHGPDLRVGARRLGVRGRKLKCKGDGVLFLQAQPKGPAVQAVVHDEVLRLSRRWVSANFRERLRDRDRQRIARQVLAQGCGDIAPGVRGADEGSIDAQRVLRCRSTGSIGRTRATRIANRQGHQAINECRPRKGSRRFHSAGHCRMVPQCLAPRMRHEEERVNGARMQDQSERAPPHWLNPLGGQISAS
jgi:hypothetical protein